MVTLITRPYPGTRSGDAPPAGSSIETRQNRRRAALKAAKEITAADPKKLGLRRRDWRQVFA